MYKAGGDSDGGGKRGKEGGKGNGKGYMGMNGYVEGEVKVEEGLIKNKWKMGNGEGGGG